MRYCNKCLKNKANDKFKSDSKLTCKKCEYRFKQRILRLIVEDRKMSIQEKLSSRIGYLGAGLLISAQWTIEPILYVLGFVCVIVQVSFKKQWNLVALNLNGLIAWATHFIKG